MPDFSKGKIYKVVSDHTDLCYIGSTCQSLSYRLNNHRQDVKRCPNYAVNTIISLGDYRIELVEEYPCNNNIELRTRERFHYEQNKCCNKITPISTQKETKHNYYLKHKEEILQKSKEYQQTEKSRLQKQQYRDNHKEQIRLNNHNYKANMTREQKDERNKRERERRRKNKENGILPPCEKLITCECGCKIRSDCLARHIKTQKHLAFYI